MAISVKSVSLASAVKVSTGITLKPAVNIATGIKVAR